MGTVLDENNNPVIKAKVSVDAVDRRPTHALIRYVETDAAGHFQMDRLAWGKYKVFAENEAVGYPDMRWSFYSNDIFPTVVITPAAPTAKLQIPLGPKAGALKGSITNAVTGAPVNAGFKLSRAIDPNKWISTSVPPKYRVLLPPATDVLLEASAPGFRTWTPGHAVRLQPGSEMTLDIRLEPTHDPNLHPSKFLVPDGYVGWVVLEYNVKDAEPVPMDGVTKVFKFPSSGTLNTLSSGPERGADDGYFYYSPDGSLHQIPTDYRSGKAMIWGQHEGTRNGAMTQFGFFVGSEEQYKKYESRTTHPGPILLP